jgi:Sec-independent protein secretion pathway component TatC
MPLPIAITDSALGWLFVWWIVCPFVAGVIAEYRGVHVATKEVGWLIVLGGIGVLWAILHRPRRRPNSLDE